MQSISQRQCKKCGTTYHGDEVRAMFAVSNLDKYTNLKTVCNPCLLTARTQAKEANRFVTKAKNTIAHHAKKFGLSAPEMADRFLWAVDRVAHDMEHAWQNGCNDCGYAFKSMPNGLHDLTLDIINPNQPPYYGTNTRFVCTTCNRKKSRTDPTLWGAMKAAWARWKKRQEWLAAQPKWHQEDLWSADES